MDRGKIWSLALSAATALASLVVILGVAFSTNPLTTFAVVVAAFVLAACGIYAYFSLGLVRADTEAEIARLRKLEREFNEPPQPPQPALPEPDTLRQAQGYNREIPRHTAAGDDTIKLQVAADKYDSIWREMCIRLLVWSEMKGGITVSLMVGRGESFPLASNTDWMALTNVLQDSGYILKDGVSRLNPRYSSFSQAALVISRGGQCPHPETYPPAVREIPEKLTITPEWESAVNAQ